MTFFDFICGCRMHLCFICLCGVLDDFTLCVLDFFVFLCFTVFSFLDILDLSVCNNRLFYLRLRGLSVFCF